MKRLEKNKDRKTAVYVSLVLLMGQWGYSFPVPSISTFALLHVSDVLKAVGQNTSPFLLLRFMLPQTIESFYFRMQRLGVGLTP